MEGVIVITIMVSSMIIVPLTIAYKDLKERYKELQEAYGEKAKKVCFNKTEHDECSFEKITREFKRKYEEKESQLKELDRMFKALLYNFNNYEVEISEDDMKRAERGNIYIEQAYLKFAKRVKLLFNENYFDTKKEDN